MTDHESSPLKRAVELVGGQVAFGALIGRTQGAISKMLSNDRPLPGEFVLTVEEATGISRHELRPDLYPLEGRPTPARASSLGEVRP